MAEYSNLSIGGEFLISLGKLEPRKAKEFSSCLAENEFNISFHKNDRPKDGIVWSKDGGIEFSLKIHADGFNSFESEFREENAVAPFFFKNLILEIFCIRKNNQEAFLCSGDTFFPCQNNSFHIPLRDLVFDEGLAQLCLKCHDPGVDSVDKPNDKSQIGVCVQDITLVYNAARSGRSPSKEEWGSYFLSVFYALKKGINIVGVEDFKACVSDFILSYHMQKDINSISFYADMFNLICKISMKLDLGSTLPGRIFRCFSDSSKKNMQQTLGVRFVEKVTPKDFLFEVPFEFHHSAESFKSRKNYFPEVVQYWEGKEVPKEVIHFNKSVRRLGFRARIYNRESAREFIKSFYSESVAELFDVSWHPAMEADVFRVLYCAANPAIYLDSDWQFKDEGELFFTSRHDVNWFRLIYNRKSDVLAGRGPYINNDMLYFGSGDFGPALAKSLINDLHDCKFNKNWKKKSLHALTGPGLLQRFLVRNGVLFSSHNLAYRDNIGGVAAPVYNTPFGKVGFVDNRHFAKLRISANPVMSKGWVKKDLASNWRACLYPPE